MTPDRFPHSFTPDFYFDKDQGGVGRGKEASTPIAEEDHLAAVALEAFSILENDPEWFRHHTKIGVAREISRKIESGDSSFNPRVERTLVSHIHESGAFLRNIVQADVYAKEIRTTNLEGLYLQPLLNSEKFTEVPNSWREALTKLSETLPNRTTVGTVAATLMYFSESSSAKNGDTIQGRLKYASTRVKNAFNFGPRFWWNKE